MREMQRNLHVNSACAAGLSRDEEDALKAGVLACMVLCPSDRQPGPHQGAKARVVPVCWGCQRCADLTRELHLVLNGAILRMSRLAF